MSLKQKLLNLEAISSRLQETVVFISGSMKELDRCDVTMDDKTSSPQPVPTGQLERLVMVTNQIELSLEYLQTLSSRLDEEIIGRQKSEKPYAYVGEG